MPPLRRTILRCGILLGSVGLTGCVTEQDDGTPTSDEMPTEIQLWFEEVTLSESEQNSIEPIVFGDLPNGQKEIVQTALEEGEYTSEIGGESSAMKNLRESISARTDGGLKAYLKQDDIYYRIGLVSGDHIIADPSH